MSYISRKQLEAFGMPIGEPKLGEKSRYNVAGHRHFGGGGKGDSEAPDYTAVAQASEKAAAIGAELGREQLAESKRQYEITRATAEPVVAAQLGLMNQQQVQGDDYFNYMKSYSRPVEQSLYYESMGFTPEEIQQIEASRGAETAKFKATQTANQQARIPTTFDVPTTETKIPAGAQKGSAVGMITIPNPTPRPNTNGGGGMLSIAAAQNWKPTITVKADPNAYYIKNADGTYQTVQPEIIQGTKSVSTDVPRGNDGSYAALDTPDTDALTAKLGAEASARLKAADATQRAELLGLNTNLAKRIGESDVDVYNRNQADIEAESGMALADARKGFTDTTNSVIREGLRYGMSPAKIAAANAAQATAQATVQAGAVNGTRKAAVKTMYDRGVGESGQLLTGGEKNRNNKIQDEAIGTAKKLDVAGLYRNLPGASQGAYGLSLNAGNAAVNNTATPGTNLLAGNNSAANTILQGSQQQLSGLTGIVNSQTSMANNSGGGGSAIWGALGTVGGAFLGGPGGAAIGNKIGSSMSDENVKKDIEDFDDEEALEGIKKTKVKTWKYDSTKVDGLDNQRHVGAMAQDLKKNLGSEVSNGHMVDLISAVGVNMSAIKALANKVDKIEGAKK